MCDISLRYLIYHITGIFSFSLTPMFEANTVTIRFTNIYVAARRWEERRYLQVILLDFYIHNTDFTNESQLCSSEPYTAHCRHHSNHCTRLSFYSTLLGSMPCMLIIW